MHMELNTRHEAKTRDAAAKRTSESTVMAAKRAQAEGYKPLKRQKNTSLIPAWTQPQPLSPQQQPSPSAPVPAHAPVPPPPPASTAQPGSQPASQAPLPSLRPAAQAEAPKPSRNSRPHVARVGPLTPEETKSEQARLLTLLRGLNPVQVVDQLCKALAYFGGIPDAPALEDGKFPDSAEGNGMGSLFVGWLSEIFPPVDGNAPRPRGGVVVNGVIRRPRGRPRGSKTRNRGIMALKRAKKKGAAAEAGTDPSTQDANDNGVDDSWVEMDDGDLDDGEGRDETVDALALIAAASVSGQGSNVDPLTTTNDVPTPVAPAAEPAQAAELAPPPPAAIGRPAIGAEIVTDASHIDTAAASGGRRRGRPKGSKNKPKQDGPGAASTSAAATDSIAEMPQAYEVDSQEPKSSPLIHPIQPGSAVPPATPQRHRPGRPKGSKNKPKTPAQAAAAIVSAAVQSCTIASNSPAEGAVLDSRTPLPPLTAQTQEESNAQRAKGSAKGTPAAATSKRKRPSAAIVAEAAGTLATTGTSSMPMVAAGHEVGTQVEAQNPQPPPTKKQRRGRHINHAPSASFNATTGDDFPDISNDLPDPVHALALATSNDDLRSNINETPQSQPSDNAAGSAGGNSVQSQALPSQSLAQTIPRTQQQQLSNAYGAAQATISGSPTPRNNATYFAAHNRNIFAASQLGSQHLVHARHQQQAGNAVAGNSASHPAPDFASTVVTSPENSAVAAAAAATFNRVSSMEHNTSASSSDPASSFINRSSGSQGTLPPHQQQHHGAASYGHAPGTSTGAANVSSFGAFTEPGFLDIRSLDSVAAAAAGGAYGTIGAAGTATGAGNRGAANSAAYTLWRNSQT